MVLLSRSLVIIPMFTFRDMTICMHSTLLIDKGSFLRFINKQVNEGECHKSQKKVSNCIMYYFKM